MSSNNEHFEFEIIEHIATLSTSAKGWTKELNLISYNDSPPKYDLRSWDSTHEKMGKGLTMSKEELVQLKEALENALNC